MGRSEEAGEPALRRSPWQWSPQKWGQKTLEEFQDYSEQWWILLRFSRAGMRIRRAWAWLCRDEVYLRRSRRRLNTAKALAYEVRERYDLDIPTNLATIVAAEKISVCWDDVPGDGLESIIGRLIRLKQGLDSRERRWMLAHALGHHFQHKPGVLYFYRISYDWEPPQEDWQADVFAAHLLMPDSDFLPLLNKGTSVEEMIYTFDVPWPLVEFRIALARSEQWLAEAYQEA